MEKEKIEQMESKLLALGGSYLLGHARRVYRLSCQLAEKEKVSYDGDVLLFASYFHDISAFPPYKPEGEYDHASQSAKLAPEFAIEYGFGDDAIAVIVEVIENHNKAGTGSHVETRLLRNADGVDYLGLIAVARDFSKEPDDMRKAIAAMRTRKEQYYTIVDYPHAKVLAAPRAAELENFIRIFEEETMGIY